MMDEKVSVQALEVKQDGKTPLYSFYIKASQILEVADISRIKKDTTGTLLGYQRGQAKSHVKEIIDYLNSDGVLFPNSIILAMSSEASFREGQESQGTDPECKPGVLDIPTKSVGEKVAWIVDGQQRTLALADSDSHSMMVPVTGFISDDFEVHRTQFLLVNKAKPLSKGLIYELLPEINGPVPASWNNDSIASELCNRVNEDPGSPFYGLIIRETTDKKENKKAVIIANSLMHVIKQSLKGRVGCLYRYKNIATGEVDLEAIKQSLDIYWDAVKETFPDAWGIPPRKSRLMGGGGFKAMGKLMDRIMIDISPNDPGAKAEICDRLTPIKGYCAWTEGVWEDLGLSWNKVQNTPSHVHALSQMLIGLYEGVE